MNVTVIVLVILILIVLVISGYVIFHHSTNTTPGTGMDCMGSWGECEGDCGIGTQTYNITRKRKGGGTDCPEEDGNTRDCDLDPCGPPPGPPSIGCEGTTGLSRVCCEAKKMAVDSAGQIVFYEALKKLLKPSELYNMFKGEYKKNLSLIEDAMKSADIELEKLGSKAATKTIEKKTVLGRALEYLKGKPTEVDKFIRSGIKSGDLAKESPTFHQVEDPEALFKKLFEDELIKGGMNKDKIAETIAKRAALLEGDALLGPVGWALDGIMAAGMFADVFGNKGFVNFSTTQDLIARRDELIGQLETQEGLIFPYIVGPLDADRVAHPDDLNTLVVGKMFDLLLSVDANTTDANVLPNPLLIQILSSVTTFTNDADLLTSITVGLQSIPQANYDALFDLAFESLCTDQGGILIDSGIAGYPKFCSYPDKESCHASCEWNPAIGSAKADSIYTEWRSQAFFGKYNYQNIPASGACIMMDDSLHRFCNRPAKIRTWRYESIRHPQVYYDYYSYYTYNRESGVCTPVQNQCLEWGIGYQGDNTVTDSNPTLSGIKYGSCKQNNDWATWFMECITGEVIPNEVSSCLTSSTGYKPYCNQPEKWCLYRGSDDTSSQPNYCKGNDTLLTRPN
jgi:hypothetical protein